MNIPLYLPPTMQNATLNMTEEERKYLSQLAEKDRRN